MSAAAAADEAAGGRVASAPHLVIGVVTGSTRPGRAGPSIAARVLARVAATAHDARPIDLAELALPFLDEPHQPSDGHYTHRHTLDWAATVTSCDALIIVTPEYNWGYPASVKNAIDYLYAEWAGKPVGLVGYGWGGALRSRAGLSQVLGRLKARQPESVAVYFTTHLDATTREWTGAPDDLAALDREIDALIVALAGLAADDQTVQQES